jgi:hypothetical protein
VAIDDAIVQVQFKRALGLPNAEQIFATDFRVSRRKPGSFSGHCPESQLKGRQNTDAADLAAISLTPSSGDWAVRVAAEVLPIQGTDVGKSRRAGRFS